MAYRLREDESVAKGLKRVVARELRRAVMQLEVRAPSHDAIHEARKSIKKVRAVITLLRGHHLAGRAERKWLSRAGHLLAPLRDTDVLIATVDTLCRHDVKLLDAETCTDIRDGLRRRKRRLWDAGTQQRAGRQAAKILEKLRRSARGWPWKRIGFSELSTAVGRSYKNARSQMGLARERNTAAEFHQWRKRVKTLVYALRLIDQRAPRRQLAADLERLEAALGEDHDLMTFGLHARANRDLTKSSRQQIGVASERRQIALRRKALSIGARVFKPTPHEFVGKLSA